MTDDWRLRGQESYLTGRSFRWATWWPYRPDRDHDHCELCDAEISDRPVDEHTEYNAAWVTTDDLYHWMCPQCFENFHDRFRWIIVGDAPNA